MQAAAGIWTASFHPWQRHPCDLFSALLTKGCGVGVVGLGEQFVRRGVIIADRIVGVVINDGIRIVFCKRVAVAAFDCKIIWSKSCIARLNISRCFLGV